MEVDEIINKIREKHQELLPYFFLRLVYKNITSDLTGDYI